MIYTVIGTWTVWIDVEADSEEEARDLFYDELAYEHQDFEIISVERKEE
jgi:hypothetical protein